MADFKHIPTKPTLGLGCWAIGGPFFMEDRAVGWGEVDDNVSKAAVAAALEHGIKHFDTAQAYGCGHSEVVLGAALKAHPNIAIATKIGWDIDTETKQLIAQINDPEIIRKSIDASRKRLGRDRIDMVLHHNNELAVEDARPTFDMLAGLYDDGIIGAYGWSTDFSDSLRAFADHPGFTTVEHAMNVFLPATQMVRTVEETNQLSLIRSPLAMGVLGGRYDANTTFSKDEIRGSNPGWQDYFKDGKITDAYIAQLNAVRETLMSDGRSLAQGAIAWLWARTPNAMPIPGFRTPEQVHDLCGALDHGALTPAQMTEIETILERSEEGNSKPH
ncbi:aryl-alcohol dehydrogenase-like predicted oxidoreductase [Yoonia maricola]|uniref:Aryl-alcohol dehydrogenase-like predicted oxidoreductase n=1 Tax=Yoonia maricola TaxID=420999 RepID=A0A2M8WKN5_9RHOB|nr:aldo/keto reductase [Yoonia maricola]PJI91491.1 aryl-alcohol dehydrogenase-like predicted oxidoreductase [Yoonia maricola]